MANEGAGPLAIVGIACRFPGGADSPSAFWQLLCDGVEAIREIPADRFDLRRLFDDDPAQPGRLYTRRGGFLDRIDGFDAGFFGMSPREAKHIDPQQRLLLELAWEAMEDAGIRADALAGTAAGVFIGISTHDYGDIQTYPANRHLIGSHTNTGTATSLAANRISYAFDLRGPSLIVDTACSSSLTAVHLACQSLRSAECHVAIVGGVQLQVTPEPTIGFCKASMLSPDGRCRAFDAGANGYVRSEGGGVVILRPLAAAIASGDPIYAVIRGSAINQDGRTIGMTVPSASAQEAMLRAALENAGLTARDLDYVEAHGTGTPVGDPIEAAAIGAVLSERLPPGRSCAIGSVKTNIGHLEAASGMAGLIKTALAIRHRAIPPSLNFESPNPAIDFDRLRLRVVTALETWPETGAPATAGVNGFGFGGANAHVVLQEYERRTASARTAVVPLPPDAANDRPEALVLSAKTAPALVSLAREYMTLLRGADSLEAICATAALRRTPLPHRVSIVGTRAELIDGLDAFVASERRAAVSSARVVAGATPSLAFVFSGMGPQWWAMGRQLLRDELVFRSTVERCAAALPREAGWSLLDEFHASEAVSRLAEPDLAQVTGFALQAALAEWLRSVGVVPNAVLGHSAGEMAAAFVSGALSLEDCVTLAWHRSRLQARGRPGRMIAAAISESAALRLVEASAGRLSLAAVNSPSAITLSGDAGEIASLHERLQQEQVFSRIIPFPVAYHSSHMDAIERDLLDSLACLEPRDESIPMISAVTGQPIKGRELDADYWWRNVREPVRFAAGMVRLIADGYRTFLEIGPHPVLASSMAECLAAAGHTATILATLRRNENERAAMLRALGGLHVEGCPVNWVGVFGTQWTPVGLPLYPWQRERHWFESAPETSAPALVAAENGSHPLLGRRLETATATWETSFSQERTRYLDDHVVQGEVVFPGVGYLEMAAAAAKDLRSEADVVLHDVAFVSPLFGGDGRRSRVQLTLDRSGRFEVQSQSGSDGAWTLHAHGRTTERAEPMPSSIDVQAIRDRCGAQISHSDCYAQLEARGLRYGPAFRGIQTLSNGSGEALGRIGLTQALTRDEGYAVHPALFDAALQVLIGAAASGRADERSRLFLPIGIQEVSYRQPVTGEVWSYAKVTMRNDRHLTGDVYIAAADGTVLVTVKGLRCQIVEEETRAAESIADWLYEDRWEPMPQTGGATAANIGALDAARLRKEAETLSEATGWNRYYDEIEPALDALACAHAVRAVKDLGWHLTSGERITSESIDATIPASRRQFADRLLSLLETSGVLRQVQGGYTVLTTPEDKDPAVLSSSCRSAWPHYGVHLDLLDRCGASLADNLRGARGAQEILFAGDGFALLEKFYREAPASAFYNSLVARVVSSLVAGAAIERRLAILEVGAGTGGTTAAVLPLLERRPDTYVFTDVSRRFLDAAAPRLAAFPFVSTAICDLENDRLDSALPADGFDLVLAANVVHATADIAAALGRIRRLLAPGGVLVLLEITVQPAWLDVVFGLTDGWWQFRDRSVRPEHPLLNGARWTQALNDAGFEAIEAVSDSVHEGETAQRVFVARTPRQLELGRTDAGCWVILADARGVANSLADRFKRAGDSCVVLTSRERLDAVLADPLPTRGVIHLRSLDCDEAADAKALMDSQQTICGSVLEIARTLAADARPPALWLVTAGAPESVSIPGAPALAQSSLWGLGRVLMRELPELRCRLVEIGPVIHDDDLDALVVEVSSGDDTEEEVAFRRGTRFVRRLHRAPAAAAVTTDKRPPQPDERWSAYVGTPGALQTLEFRARPLVAADADQVDVRIVAASINFRDVMLAMGTIPGLEQETTLGSQQLGLDAAGIVAACGSQATRFSPGDAVMGIVPGAFGSRGTTAEALLVKKPERLDSEQAACVPCVFVTAHYALNHLARLREGERVLIHSAAGGVGLAAIQFARAAGAEIFATAGSDEKRAYLASLGIPHVMDSRSTAFADEILRVTSGEGVDVVLNSLAGDALAAGLRVLRPFGRFLEIGKRDIYADAQLGLLPFRRNLSLHAIDLDRLCVERPALVGTLLGEVADRFDRGELQPLPQRSWPISHLEEAMRFMAQARHTGKLAVSIDDSGVMLSGAPSSAPLCRADGTYLITGGLGGFGLAVAERLLRRGAGCVVLIGRRAPSAVVQRHLDTLSRVGSGRIEVVQCDVSIAGDIARVLDRVRHEWPPLRGVVHAAMVLDDGGLDRMEWPQFERVLAPKVAGAWNLHAQTLDDPLDLFVMFSSIAALFGNPLQGNYAAANAYLDALAQHRHARGMCGLSVAWGVLGDVGYVADRRELAEYIAAQGYLAFSRDQALDVLEAAIEQRRTTVVAARIDWRRWREASTSATRSARFRAVAGERLPSTSGVDSSAIRGSVDLSNPATPHEEIEAYLRSKIARVLGASPVSIEPDKPLTECGLDSLIAVELMTALRIDLGLEVPVVKLLQGITMKGLTNLALERIRNGAAVVPSAVAPLIVTAVGSPRETDVAIETVKAAVVERPIDAADPQVHFEGDTQVGPTERAAAPQPPPTEAEPAIEIARAECARWSKSQQLARFGLQAIMRATTRLRVEGLERLPAHGPAILALNHLSAMDVPLALAVLPRPAVMLAKDDLRRWRIVDWLLSDIGHTIYVKRGEGDRDALEQALAVLRSGGIVAIGPEGRRSPDGLAQGHTGVGFLAAHARAPVVPMAAWGQERLGRSWRSLRRAPIHVRLGAPIVFPSSAPSSRDLRDYTDVVMRAIAAQLPVEYRGVYGDRAMGDST